MSILDILGNGSSFGEVLNSLGARAGAAASELKRKTPGGMGGLLGAGALGALLGNLGSSDMLKNAALVGAGAVAWNFYKKWAGNQSAPQETREEASFGTSRQSREDAPSGWEAFQKPASSAVMAIDPTAELIMRVMVYAVKADGNIDASEKNRMKAILRQMTPGEDVSGILQRMEAETIDPKRIAAETRSPEQAGDIYRLSCSVIDIDHFMERGYLDALATALNIQPQEQQKIESEAAGIRRQLEARAN